MTERELHYSVKKWLDVALPLGEYGARYTHVDSFAPSRVRGAINKSIGVTPGIPDFLIWWQDRPVIGIELKTATGRLSEAQKALHAWAERVGQPWHVCRSIDDVERVLRRYGVPLKVAG